MSPDTKKFRVAGMHCNGCASKIQDALLRHPHIKTAAVTFSPAEATITLDQPVALDELNQAVKTAGNYRLESGLAENQAASNLAVPEAVPVSYWPLLLVFSYLAGGVLLAEFYLSRWNWADMMANFMGGFFIVFSFFKMLNLRGFAASYASYDVLAKHWMGYGYLYAFIELALGLAYLLRLAPFATELATVVVMALSSVGVIQSLVNKRKIQCACLGTVFNLPMSSVTLVEDLLMLVMAAAMLALGHK